MFRIWVKTAVLMSLVRALSSEVSYLVRLVNSASTNFGTVQTVGQAQLGTAPNNFDRSGERLRQPGWRGCAWQQQRRGQPFPHALHRLLPGVCRAGLLLNDRVVLGYSWRRDSVKSASVTSVTNATYPRTSAGGLEYLDHVYDSVLRHATYAAGLPGEKTKPNRSIVVHPLRWFSAHYAELGNGSVTGLTRHHLDGSNVELGTGAGKEYGVTLSLFGDRLSVRLNKYVSQLVGVQASPLGGANNVAQAPNGGGGNQIRDDLPAIEQAALRAGAPLSQKCAVWDQALLTYPFSPATLPASQAASSRDDFDFIVDRESRGYELTVVGNPTSP